jgi:hypothetical protein
MATGGLSRIENFAMKVQSKKNLNRGEPELGNCAILNTQNSLIFQAKTSFSTFLFTGGDWLLVSASANRDS